MKKIAPCASVIVNCMYWESRFPRLLSTQQLQDLMKKGCPLIGISDITCDIGGSIEFVNQNTTIDSPFFRYDPETNSYHQDMDGKGVICLAVDILPTEFAKEASQHFGDILSQFIGTLASIKDFTKLPSHLKRACIAHGGALTPLYEYIPRMLKSETEDASDNLANGHSHKRKYNKLVSLSGHLFDKFLINEALDIIEAAGGSFHLAKCHVGQSTSLTSYSEIELGADDQAVLDKIIDSLKSIAHPSENQGSLSEGSKVSLTLGRLQEREEKKKIYDMNTKKVLIIGAGRVCQPAAEMLALIGSISSRQWYKKYLESDSDDQIDVHVFVGSLYLKDAKEIVEGIPNTTAVQLDVKDQKSLYKYISEVDVVISLLPATFHIFAANACIELKKHLVTASYVDDAMSALDEKAKTAGITILGEMGLDPGIDHMMAAKMIDEAHARNGKVKSFTSYCGGLPSPAAANNPLAYKFSWSPAGAIRAGRNPATYRSNGETINVKGENLHDSAEKFRIPDLPAFALECLPNRNSLIYGKLYGIDDEASTVFRGTLRYEGFGAIMGTLARIGLLDAEAKHPILEQKTRPTFRDFICDILKIDSNARNEGRIGEKEIAKRIVELGHSKELGTASRAAKTIMFLGLFDQKEVPASCKNAFDVSCLCMEEKLAYGETEQDMVLLHHEVEIEFPKDQTTEKQAATLLEFGRNKNGKMISAMAFTVGVPAAIGALLLLTNKLQNRGVLRPIIPEVYEPGLDILQAYGIKLMEKIE